MHSLLENSLCCIILAFAMFLPIFIIGPTFCFILFTITFFTLGTVLYKNTIFYEKYIAKFSKNYYYEYLGKDITSKQLMQHKYTFIYYYWGINGFFSFLSYFQFEYVNFCLFNNLFLLFLNSIIGLILYKKFQNSIQYNISCVIYIFLLILSL